MKVSRITPFDTEKIPNISSQLYNVHIGFGYIIYQEM